MKFSIAGLLVVILSVAFALAALREASDLWDSLVFSLTFGLLAVSVLLALYRDRPFWLGFAVFGWGYLAASLVPTIEPRLLTTKALGYVDSKVPGRGSPLVIRFTTTNGGPAQSVAFSQSGQMLATSTNGTVRVWNAVTGRLLGAGRDLRALCPDRSRTRRRVRRIRRRVSLKTSV